MSITEMQSQTYAHLNFFISLRFLKPESIKIYEKVHIVLSLECLTATFDIYGEKE